MPCGHFAHERRVMFESNVSELMVTITAIWPRSKWPVLLVRIVLQDAMRCAFYVFTELRIWVYVDDMKLFQGETSMDLPERTRNLYELLEVETEKVHLELSVTTGDTESKSKLRGLQPGLEAETCGLPS